MAEIEVTIGRLGGLGDGIAETPTGRLHVPLTAPGDRVRVSQTAKDRAELVELLVAGPDRIAPACSHFGRCGGCAVQHLAPAFVAEWKRERVAAALARAGVKAGVVNPAIAIPPQTRRRATLAARRAGKRVVVGFAGRASHRLVDLAECAVLRPELVRLIPALRTHLAILLKESETADIALALTEAGIDLLLVRERPLALSDREALAALAEALDLARVSWQAKAAQDAEPVAIRRAPSVRLGVRAVSLPAGSFLQPSAEGQDALTRLVSAPLSDIRAPVADLFSGVGAFAVPASDHAPVAAYDCDRHAIAALAAMRIAAITAHWRDLFREPLTVKELEAFGAVVLDPPRAGAEAQARMLAQSRVPLIIYVSCNPVSFARDAAILASGNHALIEVTPVDQFLWSPHIELAGVFRREE